MPRLPILAVSVLAGQALAAPLDGVSSLNGCGSWAPEVGLWFTPDDVDESRQARFFHVDQNTYGLGYGVVQFLSFAVPAGHTAGCQLILGPAADRQVEGPAGLTLDVYRASSPSTSYRAAAEDHVLVGRMILNEPGPQTVDVALGRGDRGPVGFVFEFSRPGRARVAFQQTIGRTSESGPHKGMYLQCCPEQEEL